MCTLTALDAYQWVERMMPCHIWCSYASPRIVSWAMSKQRQHRQTVADQTHHRVPVRWSERSLKHYSQMRSLTFMTPDQRSQNRKSHEKVFWLLCWYQVWQSTSAKVTVSSRTVKFVKYVEHTASHENHSNTGCWVFKLCSLLVSVWSLQRFLAERP